MHATAANGGRLRQLLTDLNAPEGIHPSLVEGVRLLKTSRSSQPTPVLYEPCIVIVAGGQKRFHLPDRILTYDERQYLLLTVPVPADCETVVGDDGPFLALAVRIDLGVLSDVFLTLGTASKPSCPEDPPRRAATPTMTPALSDVAIRLAACLHAPDDAKVLGPQLVRELLYRVLAGGGREALQGLLLGDANRAQVHRILERMHIRFDAALDVARLARDVGMSASALHLHFKSITGTSPVQYLKLLRLHKARQLMVQSSLSAAVAAERVGYGSPSQFSREFKRLFGCPPVEEAQRVKAAFGF